MSLSNKEREFIDNQVWIVVKILRELYGDIDDEQHKKLVSAFAEIVRLLNIGRRPAREVLECYLKEEKEVCDRCERELSEDEELYEMDDAISVCEDCAGFYME